LAKSKITAGKIRAMKIVAAILARKPFTYPKAFQVHVPFTLVCLERMLSKMVLASLVEVGLQHSLMGVLLCIMSNKLAMISSSKLVMI
jgi:hypothetical protein